MAVGGGNVRAGRAFVELYADRNRLTRDLKAVRTQLKAFADGVTATGQQLLKASLGGGMLFGLSAKTFGDFDQQMRMVETQLSEPSKFMGQFRSSVRDLSIEFGESTTTIAKGLYDILSAAIPPEEALGLLRTTMISAQGGITDVATSTKVMVAVLNSFHISASRAGEVADTLFMSVKRGVFTFEELAEYLGTVTATAAQAGLSLDELGAALATMTRNGLQADTATTALGNILKEFLDPTKEAAATAKKLGVELNTTTIKSMGLLGVMKLLSKATPEEVAKIFPDIRGLRGALAAVGDVKGFATDLELMKTKAGSADAAYRIMSGGITTSFKKMWQAGVGVFSSIGEAIAKPIAVIAQFGMLAGRVLANLIEKHPRFIQYAALATIVVGGLGAALVGFGVSARIAVFGLGFFTGALSPVFKLIGALNRVIIDSVMAVGKFAVSLGMTLASALFTVAKSIGGVLLGGLRMVGSLFLSVAKGALSFAVAVWNVGWAIGKGLVWGAKNLEEAADITLSVIEGLVSGIKAWVSTINVLAAKSGEMLLSLTMSAVEAAASFGVTLLSAIATVGVTLTVIAPVIMGIVSTVGALASAVGILGMSLWKIGGLIVNAFGKAATGAIGGLKKDLGSLGSAFAGFGSYFAGWGDLFGKIASDGSAAFGRLAGDVTSAFSGIQDAIASEQWGLAWRIMKDTFLVAWGEISNVLAGSWDGIMSQLGKAWAGVWFAAMTGWDWLLSEIKIGWMSLSLLLEETWDKIGIIASNTWTKVLSDFGVMLTEIGRKMQGSFNPITNQIGAALRTTGAGFVEGAAKRPHLAESEFEDERDEKRKKVAGQIEDDRNARAAGIPGRGSQADAQAKAAAENLKGILGTPGTSQKKLDDLRADLEDAIYVVSEEGQDRFAEWMGWIPSADEIAEKTKGVDLEAAGGGDAKGTATTGQKSSVRGTFSASAAAAMGTGGGVQERIAKATEKANKSLDDVAKLLLSIDQTLYDLDLEAAP
jgi:TP901 family phage tail tape measure protein